MTYYDTGVRGGDRRCSGARSDAVRLGRSAAQCRTGRTCSFMLFEYSMLLCFQVDSWLRMLARESRMLPSYWRSSPPHARSRSPSGADGWESHESCFDVTYSRCVPHTLLFARCDVFMAMLQCLLFYLFVCCCVLLVLFMFVLFCVRALCNAACLYECAPYHDPGLLGFQSRLNPSREGEIPMIVMHGIPQNDCLKQYSNYIIILKEKQPKKTQV